MCGECGGDGVWVGEGWVEVRLEEGGLGGGEACFRFVLPLLCCRFSGDDGGWGHGSWGCFRFRGEV